MKERPASPRGRWNARLLSFVLGIVALLLLIGGVWLAVLGGSSTTSLQGPLRAPWPGLSLSGATGSGWWSFYACSS